MIRRIDWTITALIAGLILALLYAPEVAPYFAVAWVTAAVVRR
jgi:Na+-transporting NADH:ubiquinone oxidoreductase subunit NqrB